MPHVQPDVRLREDQTARWWITRTPHKPHRRKARHKTFLVVAGFLGLTLGLGLGPMVGALGDAVETFDPHEPTTLLSRAARHLRNFQSRVSDLRMRDLIETVTTAYWKHTPKG